MAAAGSKESCEDEFGGKAPRPGETASVLAEADCDWEAESEAGDAMGRGGVANAKA